ncbi:histidine phosphatase family protein [Sphingobium sp. AN558]|uniref:histidine phosphatase family protein n=1 Tax=Sphingobium sp. AN558 TaxID=3133442 RepID=UPI0030C0AD03
MTPVILHLLRHGAPETAGRMIGHSDIPSTAAGIESCRAQALNLDIDHIVSSDLRRAQHAATAIAGDRALPVAVDPRWRELNFGDWDGLSSQDIDAATLGAFWDDPDENPPPRGERWSALVDRVAAALADLAPKNTLVVTHGGAMRAALGVLCGFDQRRSWAFALPYSARLSFQIWPGSPQTAQIVALHS